MQWYEELFQDYAERYGAEVFTQGTIGEANFIEREIGFKKDAAILDIGCGTGRHAITLAQRGYSVTGIDLSDSMLAKARELAAASNVTVEFMRKDARDFNFNESFDLAIMICEGAFCLMETDEMNFAILKNVFLSLKKNGKLIFTALNGLFPLFHSVRDFINQANGEGTTAKNTFDLMTFRDYSLYTVTGDSGTERKLRCNERYYVPSEIRWLLQSIGFTNIGIYGAKLGAFSREDALSTEDFEMLVIAEKL